LGFGEIIKYINLSDGRRYWSGGVMIYFINDQPLS